MRVVSTEFLDSSEEDEEEVADTFVLHQRREKNSTMRWGGNHSSFRQCKKEYDRLDESAHYLERARLNMEELLAERRDRKKVEGTVVQGLVAIGREFQGDERWWHRISNHHPPFANHQWGRSGKIISHLDKYIFATGINSFSNFREQYTR